MPRHNFKCNKCKLTFGFDTDLADINRFKKKLKRGIRCPECDDQWGKQGSNIVQEIQAPSKTRDIEKLRRANAQASADAKAAAAKYAGQVGMPKMVDVKRPSRGANVGVIPGKDIERVPKSVVDSLQFRQGFEPDK